MGQAMGDDLARLHLHTVHNIQLYMSDIRRIKVSFYNTSVEFDGKLRIQPRNSSSCSVAMEHLSSNTLACKV